jgi:hypothetical protein
MALGKSLQSKQVRGIVVGIAALAVVGVVAVTNRDNGADISILATDEETKSQTESVTGGKVQSSAGENVFALPKASPDFVGTWHGVLPAVHRDPPHWGFDKHAFGTGFFLINNRVVMKLALWAGTEAKITRLNASGVSSKHVRVENEIATRDTAGAAMWIHEQRDIVLLNRDALECTETVTFYRDPQLARAVGRVQYRGTLKRASEAEMKAHARELERQGMTKQAETETQVPSR